jgi:prefoldin subunit 5
MSQSKPRLIETPRGMEYAASTIEEATSVLRQHRDSLMENISISESGIRACENQIAEYRRKILDVQAAMAGFDAALAKLRA